MNYWRMCMNGGTGGIKMWPECRKRKIAAIGYWDDDDGKLIVGNCNKISPEEFNEIWRKKAPHSTCCRSSLRCLAYGMKAGDIIYAKEGRKIVGKGEITSPYQYNTSILKGTECEWPHYVRVDWYSDFKEFEDPIRIRNTIIKLEGEDLLKFKQMDSTIRKEDEKDSSEIKLRDVEDEEGEAFIREVTWRARKRKLIYTKKAQSDYRCEVCGMKFEEVYGTIGEKYIIAHHKNPIGMRTEASTTTLKDIALVCPNCHVMLHKKDPPLSIQELSNRMKVKLENVKH